MQTGIRPITSMLTQPDDGRSSMSPEAGNRGSLRGFGGKKEGKKTMSRARYCLPGRFRGSVGGGGVSARAQSCEVPRGAIRDEADAI